MENGDTTVWRMKTLQYGDWRHYCIENRDTTVWRIETLQYEE